MGYALHYYVCRVHFDLINHAVHVLTRVEVHRREFRQLYRQILHTSTTATKPSYDTVDTEPEYSIYRIW